MQINFQTQPESYRHWHLEIDGDVATLWLDVSEDDGLFDGYQLKLNSYDLGVDIELYDATQRLRFEHPTVRTVVIRSHLDRVFCAGAEPATISRLISAQSPTNRATVSKTRALILDNVIYVPLMGPAPGGATNWPLPRITLC